MSGTFPRHHASHLCHHRLLVSLMINPMVLVHVVSLSYANRRVHVLRNTTGHHFYLLGGMVPCFWGWCIRAAMVLAVPADTCGACVRACGVRACVRVATRVFHQLFRGHDSSGTKTWPSPAG